MLNFQQHILRKNSRFAPYLLLCTNYAKEIAQKRAKRIALHAQKMRKSSQKIVRAKIAQKNMVVLWKLYVHPTVLPPETTNLTKSV